MSFALPGDKIAQVADLKGVEAGKGVYVKDGTFVASLSGTVKQYSTLIEVIPQSTSNTNQTVPGIGEVILGRVVKLNSKYAGVEILGLAAANIALMEPVKGTIRSQDIYPHDVLDQPPVHQSFRPGDVVRARVIGVGDTSAGLLLSTGVSEDLGVVYGRSAAADAPLLPSAWNEMTCSRTGLKERRKCAKPQENK